MRGQGGFQHGDVSPGASNSDRHVEGGCITMSHVPVARRLAAAAAVLAAMALPAVAYGNARVTMSPAAGQPGTQVELRGQGFGRSKAVVVRRGHRRVARQCAAAAAASAFA